MDAGNRNFNFLFFNIVLIRIIYNILMGYECVKNYRVCRNALYYSQTNNERSQIKLIIIIQRRNIERFFQQM